MEENKETNKVPTTVEAVKQPKLDQLEEYNDLVKVYLEKAEEIFGKKTDYEFEGVTYRNGKPQVILSDTYFLTGVKAYVVKLSGHANDDRKDGIFQLSHEAVHLLSPVEQDEAEGNEVNYLEEGMATWFSKKITEEETKDLEYCDLAIAKDEKYEKAYGLYLKLIAIDKDAVKKLREIQPVIARILPEDFEKKGLKVDKEVINALLEKF